MKTLLRPLIQTITFCAMVLCGCQSTMHQAEVVDDLQRTLNKVGINEPDIAHTEFLLQNNSWLLDYKGILSMSDDLGIEWADLAVRKGNKRLARILINHGGAALYHAYALIGYKDKVLQ